MSSAMINKIHVTNSTGLSLNDRFTAIGSHPEPQEVAVRRRSRSRSRSLQTVDRQTSLANRRLLQQLAKRHKIQAALKLKRRSMRTPGGNIAMKRGTIKALRVAPNGRPIRANSLTKIATMRADLISNGSRSTRPLRRANSSSNIAGRLGSRRPVVGGAAQRVAQRRLQRLRTNNGSAHPTGGAVRRGRSRSRSRGRVPEIAQQQIRGRSLSRGRAGNVRGRSLSGGRVENVRGRSRSRSRGRNDASVRAALPIKARLGIRLGAQAAAYNESRRQRAGRDRRSSISQQAVAQGRIQKRRNSVAQAGNSGVIKKAVGAGGRVGRTRSRSNTRNLGGHSSSRTRKGAAVGQQKYGAGDQGHRRGRSQQRNGGRGGAALKNGKGSRGTNGQQQHNQRRGRSRSRGGRVGRGGRKVGGNNGNPQANKEALDKELDQYMATTKTENDMDYLLKN